MIAPRFTAVEADYLHEPIPDDCGADCGECVECLANTAAQEADRLAEESADNWRKEGRR